MPICQFVACDKDIPEHRRFCSQRCANLHRWKRTSFEPWSKMEICTVCGKEFKTTRNYRRGFKTCSKKCEGEAKRQDKLGKPLSEEHKRKVSIAHTGKKLSREHRRKIGLGVRGPRNRQWIDGRSYEKKVMPTTILNLLECSKKKWKAFRSGYRRRGRYTRSRVDAQRTNRDVWSPAC